MTLNDEIIKTYTELRSAEKTALKLNCKRFTVYRALRERKMRPLGRNPWSEDETNKLKEFFKQGFMRGDGKYVEFCKSINRPKTEVNRKAWKMGLTDKHRPTSEKRKEELRQTGRDYWKKRRSLIELAVNPA